MGNFYLGEIMNKIKIAKKSIDTNVQGYLDHFDDWSDEFVKKMAKKKK